MSTLDQIKATLEALAAAPEYPLTGGVFYGAVNVQSLDEWNYFVFNRRRVIGTNDKSYADYFEVHIVHEDYIAEGYELEVVKAMKNAIPGMSLAEEITYDYTTKGDTMIVVEICNLTFKRAKKVNA